jgi:hypothetical protein
MLKLHKDPPKARTAPDKTAIERRIAATDKHEEGNSMKRIVMTAILVTCLLAVRAAASDAAPPTGSSHYWFSLGLGGSFMPGASGVGTYALGISYERRNMILTARLAASGEPLGSYLGDIGILCGIRSHGRTPQASVAAGLSYVNGYRDDTYKTINTLGIPLEAQLTWPVGTFAGLWVGAYGNINRGLPVVGLMLGIKLGRLR